MMLDDDSLLSAYLDDELDPPDLRRVEHALRHDPDLARQVADLRRVRDLVAGLPRPAAPDDLALNVVVRIDQKRHYRSLLIATGSLAVAASLFVHVALPFLERSRQQPSVLADWGPLPAGVALSGTTDPATDDPAPALAPPISVIELAGPPREAAIEAWERDFLAVLDRPEVERFLIPVQRLDVATIGEIENDVKNTVRQRPVYYRLDLKQGDEPTTDGPALDVGKAVVFTLEATEPELSALVTRLSACSALTGKISSEPAEPRLLTAIRGASGVQALEGVQGAIISRIDPRLVDRFALLEARGRRSSEPIPEVDDAPPADGKTPSTVMIWLVSRPADD